MITKRMILAVDTEVMAVAEDVIDMVVAEVTKINILSVTTMAKEATLYAIVGKLVKAPKVKVRANKMTMMSIFQKWMIK